MLQATFCMHSANIRTGYEPSQLYNAPDNHIGAPQDAIFLAAIFQNHTHTPPAVKRRRRRSNRGNKTSTKNYTISGTPDCVKHTSQSTRPPTAVPMDHYRGNRS